MSGIWPLRILAPTFVSLTVHMTVNSTKVRGEQSFLLIVRRDHGSLTCRIVTSPAHTVRLTDLVPQDAPEFPAFSRIYRQRSHHCLTTF
jgi:hypothetical protein